jgi:hypothetical protein
MGKTFWRFGNFSVTIFFTDITYPFGLYLFFFNAHDFQVWSFDGVSEFLHIPFTALELFN